MRKAWLNFCVCLGIIASVPMSSAAQEMIHALTGTVSAIDASSGTLTVLQDNGQTGTFQIKENPKTRISFDKRVQAETTAATAFQQKNAYAIVFYFGEDPRTAVALKSLGKGPFTSATGTVAKLEGHRSLSIKDSTGAEQTFAITPQTVAESYTGVIDGQHIEAQKGDHVRIVAAKDGETPTALFVRVN